MSENYFKSFLVASFFTTSLCADFLSELGDNRLEDLVQNVQQEANIVLKNSQKDTPLESKIVKQLESAQNLKTIGDMRAFIFQQSPLPFSKEARVLFVVPPFLFYKYIDWITPEVEQEVFFSYLKRKKILDIRPRNGTVFMHTAISTLVYWGLCATWAALTYTDRKRTFIAESLGCKKCLSELAQSTMKEGYFNHKAGHECAEAALSRLKNSNKMCDAHKKNIK